MRRIFCIILALAWLPASFAFAADLNYNAVSRQCVSYTDSMLPSKSPDQIELEIHRNFGIAQGAMESSAVVVSTSSAFTWANEARISCGNAIGFWESGYADTESIAKCDCFYQRYISFR